MTKKISLDVPDNTYERLASLSEYYGQDVKQTILDILEAVERQRNWIEYRGKDYKAPVGLKRVLAHFLSAATHSIMMFNEILEKLQAKGQFELEDFEFDLGKNIFTFVYYRLPASKLCIERFYLTLEDGTKSLCIYLSAEVAKVSKESLEKLKHLAGEVEDPKEFPALEEYHVEVDDSDEEFWILVISCEADLLENLSSMKQWSRVIKRLLKKAGIQQSDTG